VTAADFASFSNNAIAFASVVFALAFLAHIAEWAMSRSVPVAAARPGAAPVVSPPVYAGAATRGEVASARAGAESAGTSTEEVSLDGSDRVGREDRMEMFGRIGVSLTVLGTLLNLAGVVARAISAGRVPWGNMYEFSTAGIVGVTAIYLLLLRRYSLRWMGVLVTGFALVVLMLSVLILYEPAGPLVPALDSYWLVIHVIAAIIATGAFVVGGMASALFLVKQRAEERHSERPAGYIARLPASATLDRVAYRLHAFGFPVWTFAALIAGPIWAEYAWGRYWGWDPKEIWAFITWVGYAAYLHARATAGWKGRTAAIIALVALATLLFNFVGINFFFGSGSMHSYA